MFQKEPLNPNKVIATLVNAEGQVLYLMTRLSPPNNTVCFAFDIGPHNNKPLYEVQKQSSFSKIGETLDKYLPDYYYSYLED